MEKVYSYLDEPQCAYLLKDGTVFFEIKDGEYYKISGKNLIVAASEVVLNFTSDSYYYRAYNFYKDDNVDLAEISPANLKNLIYKYSIGYNMNIFFAQMIKNTNKILAKRQATLTDDTKAVHEIAKTYYEISNSVADLANKTKFPDVIKLVEKFKSELIFETGKVFSKQKSTLQLEVKQEKLDDFNIAFAPNSIICSEGEESNDMYILTQGKIGVFIGENQVAEIDKHGTVIGEIALLLGDTRTATLKAIDQVVVSIIKKDNLQNFHKDNEDIFLQIGETLSQRIYNNFEIIQNIDKHENEKSEEKVAGFLNRNRAETYLIDQRKSLSDLYEEKKYEQLSELVEKVEADVKKYVR